MADRVPTVTIGELTTDRIAEMPTQAILMARNTIARMLLKTRDDVRMLEQLEAELRKRGDPDALKRLEEKATEEPEQEAAAPSPFQPDFGDQSPQEEQEETDEDAEAETPHEESAEAAETAEEMHEVWSATR